MTSAEDDEFGMWRSLANETAELVRGWVGTSADVSIAVWPNAPLITSVEITPINRRAQSISVIFEQWIVLEVGSAGGRWELDYTTADIDLTKSLVRAVIHGRIEERFGLGRSKVTVTLEDGTELEETGYNGCLPLLVPTPGWTRWGPVKRYEAYI